VGGAGGQGGVVNLAPNGNTQQLFARLAESLGPDIKVTEKDGTINVPLKETVLFEWDKDVLTPVARATLAKVAKVLVGHSDLQIIVEGHTSAPGSADYNLDLSQRRVKSVVEALASMGVGRSQMTTGAFGENRPEVRTDTEETRNRRVIIRLK
jgi:OOP family OmpA-OmpF porin